MPLWRVSQRENCCHTFCGSKMQASRAIRASSSLASGASPLRVIKFGGSSVGSAEGFIGASKVITSHLGSGSQVVCVLSAMFGVTNQLITAANAAARRDLRHVEALRSSVYLLHHTASEALPLKSSSRTRLQEDLKGVFQTLFDPAVEDVAAGQLCTAAHLDKISSIGERLSNKIMATYLSDHGVAAVDIAADNLLITTSDHGAALPNLDETAKRVRPRIDSELRQGNVPCITGFLGTSPEGNVTTLGRGGSDLTAACMANVLDAEEVILSKVEYSEQSNGWMAAWKPGWIGFVHHADVASTIPTISYEEAAELAHFQRKVLHHGAVYPALDKHIPIRVANTLDFTHPGTLIIPSSSLRPRICEITSLALASYETANKTLVDVSPPWPKEESSLIALVGHQITRIPSISDRVSAVLQAASIPCIITPALSSGTSNVAVVVPTRSVKAAAKLLHNKFVAHSDTKRWLIPSRVPVDVTPISSYGAGWA